MRLALYVVAQYGMWNVNTQSGERAGLIQVWAKDEGPLSSTNPLPAMHIGLNEHFGIIGEQKREVPVPDPSAVLYWADHSPQYPPIAGAAALMARPIRQPRRQ